MNLQTYLRIKQAGNKVNKELLRNYKILNNVPNQKGIPYPLARADVSTVNARTLEGELIDNFSGDNKADRRARIAACQHIINATLDPSIPMTRKINKAMYGSPFEAGTMLEEYFAGRGAQLRNSFDEISPATLKQRKLTAQNAMKKAPNLVSAARSKAHRTGSILSNTMNNLSYKYKDKYNL